jgi:hypothetical protein
MSGRRRFDVTATQAVASMLAALTGAIAASRLGIAGTIIGTAFMSLASTVGGAAYKFYLSRSNERLRKAAESFGTRASHREQTTSAVGAAVTREQRAGVPDLAQTEFLPVVRMTQEGVTGRTDEAPVIKSRRKWVMAAATGLGVFVIVMGGITVFEAVAGKPLDAVVWHQKSSGTTLGGLVGGGSHGTSPAPTTSPSSSGSASPTASPSGSPSSSPATSSPTTATPTPTPTPTTPATPTPSASPDPGAATPTAVPGSTSP